MRRLHKLLRSTGIAQVEAAKQLGTAIKPRSDKIMLFTTADGRVAAITRSTIDSGLVKAAGINIIDGDKLDDMEPAGNA